jgi:hypothetical protein
MKTTLNIDDDLMAQVREEAARQGKTVSELTEVALRLLLEGKRSADALPPLPRFSSGGALADVSDREALEGVMARTSSRSPVDLGRPAADLIREERESRDVPPGV